MTKARIIPCLLIHNNGLVKSKKFKSYTYVGDPINTVKIFNTKEVDEIAIIDIDASRTHSSPNLKRIGELTSEAFMPMSYGGGITNLDQIKKIFSLGIEKVIVNRAIFEFPQLITEAAKHFGSQSIVASIDVKTNFFNKKGVYINNGVQNTKIDPIELAKKVENLGAGEILLNSIDRDGTYLGFELDLVSSVSNSVNIPVIAQGGAGSLEDFRKAIVCGASAVAAGSFFVFQRPHNAVLISYPSQEDLKKYVFC